MNLFVLFFIGVRYFFSTSSNLFNKLTNILSIISISLGISAIIIVISIMNGFEDELKNNVLNFVPHVVISDSKNNINKFVSKNNKIISKNINKISETIISDVIVQSNSGMSIGSAFSIHNDACNIFKLYLTHTDNISLLKKNYYNAIMGQGLADILNINIGDKFRLITPNFSQLSIFGSIPNERVFKLINTFITDNEIDNYQILVNQDDLSNFLHYSKDNITKLRLWLKNPLDIENYLKNLHIPNVLIQDWRENKGELLQASKLEKNMMMLLFSLVVIISIISLVVSVSLFIMDKERDISIFTTLGLSRYNIILIFIFQGLLSGIIGTLLGTFLGLFIMNKTIGVISIINFFSRDFILPCSIVPHQIAVINLLTITCVLLSIIYPSWKATSIFPSKRLAYE
ncbi:FtsX-like permease family protein [Buchnera aphidicola]|uniref:FtsX-like permease family protein n=1 Tax=Buchnera aphidicola subsp. Melaphis rhois TaxID=118103 RepID=A0A4D6Y306_BUCMH|nr:FtsX-like permease family protein [Buchnera aphidicola]QCI23299.1 FtsX-like permease family protein [Buchnera aphidicola (Melaphis rhois)]